MHIILALITGLSGVLWALFRLHNSGVNLNAFNPFYWRRRTKWHQQLSTKPIHALDNPLEAAATLVIAIALLDGALTRETKDTLLQMFCDEFNINPKQASELYVALSHLLKNETNLVDEVKNILAPTQDQFTENRRDSLMTMLRKVAGLDGGISAAQSDFIQAANEAFTSTQQAKSNW